MNFYFPCHVTIYRVLAIAEVVIACLWNSVPVQSNEFAKPELVQQVLDGKLTEARVSWWGFDEKDSTKFLQQAIRSNVKRLIIDLQSSPWITKPLFGVSNQEIVLESGVELVALAGDYQNKGDCLLTFQYCENVIIRGTNEDGGKTAHLRMQKKDYQSEYYTSSEWRHGLSFLGCRNVLVQDLTIEQTGGDGIYLGTGPKHTSGKNITIRRVDCNNNHRQGISVISVEDLLIEDCQLRNTKGTAPQAGIDFEPNDPEDVLVRCVLRRCVAEGNEGTGFQICPQFMTSKSTPISIQLEECVSRKNKQHSVHLIGNPEDAPTGSLKINRLIAVRDEMAGLSVQFNPFDGIRIELSDSNFRNCALVERYFPPLYVQGSEKHGRAVGNVHIKNLLIEDELDRTILRIRGNKELGVKDITGEVVVKRNREKSIVRLTPKWMQSLIE